MTPTILAFLIGLCCGTVFGFILGVLFGGKEDDR